MNVKDEIERTRRTLTGDELAAKIDAVVNPADSATMPVQEPDDDDLVAEIVPHRGRPTKPDDQKLKEKLVVPFTEAELRDILIAAAKAGHKRPKDWARQTLLKAAKEWL